MWNHRISHSNKIWPSVSEHIVNLTLIILKLSLPTARWGSLCPEAEMTCLGSLQTHGCLTTAELGSSRCLPALFWLQITFPRTAFVLGNSKLFSFAIPTHSTSVKKQTLLLNLEIEASSVKLSCSPHPQLGSAVPCHSHGSLHLS